MKKIIIIFLSLAILYQPSHLRATEPVTTTQLVMATINLLASVIDTYKSHSDQKSLEELKEELKSLITKVKTDIINEIRETKILELEAKATAFFELYLRYKSFSRDTVESIIKDGIYIYTECQAQIENKDAKQQNRLIKAYTIVKSITMLLEKEYKIVRDENLGISDLIKVNQNFVDIAEKTISYADKIISSEPYDDKGRHYIYEKERTFKSDLTGHTESYFYSIFPRKTINYPYLGQSEIDNLLKGSNYNFSKKTITELKKLIK